jgi:hypothetical protein
MLCQFLRYQIDHRSITTPTQADRTGATLLWKADWQEPRGNYRVKRNAAGLASLSGKIAAIADRDLTMPKTGKVVLGGETT